MKINKFTVTGQKLLATANSETGSILEPKESVILNQLSRGTSEKHTIELNDADVIELIFDDGTRWYANAYTIHELFPEAIPGSRSVFTFELPSSISPSDNKRGIAGNLLLKVVNIFTKKALSKGIKQLAIELEKKQLDNHSGVFYLNDDFSFSTFIPNDTNTHYLLFLHGTASSTHGSFGDLQHTELWNHLRQTYGTNILAQQHESLSKSPLENVYNLVKALPENTSLDIISQSRGGLIGETLSRFCTDGTHEAGFSDAEMQLFKKEYPRSYFQQFKKQVEDIKKEVKSKNIRIHKFIRSACPAQGTTLASKRLDNVLNITFNLIGYASGWAVTPVYTAFKNLIAGVVDCKNNVEVLPGLESMDPSSAYIKIINAPASQPVSNNLMIISGNAKASLTFKGLLIIASKLFYLHDNDLIVDTASMYRGTKRTGMVQYFFDEGQDVNHFNYFKNKKTYDALFLAIKSDGNTLLPGFTEVNQLSPAERNAMLGIEGGEVYYDKVSGKKPIIVLIPGIMGSNIGNEKDLIWIKYLKLISGDLDKIRIDRENIKAPSLVRTSYKKMADHLLEKYDVVTFPYDWRKQLTDTVKSFSDKITQLLSYGQPVKIIAHSMGGVLVRDFMVLQPALWKQLNTSAGFRLIFLGSPLGGSFRIPAVLFGMDDLINKLSKIDIFHSKSELLEIFTRYPGILSLLPHTTNENNDFSLTDTWKKMAGAFEEWPIPGKADLDNFGRHRNKVLAANDSLDFSNAIYIAGKDKETACGYIIEETAQGKELNFLYTAEGDHSVTWESGIPAKMIEAGTVYYVNISHGALANEPAIFPAIDELLQTGKTSLISSTRPVMRGEDKIFRKKPEFDFDLSPEGIEKTLLGLYTSEKQEKPVEAPVRVSVSKGDLRYASYPMLAGHFKNDAILFAEKAIDHSLNGALTELHRMGLYPGDIGSGEVILNQKNDFQGAVIVGLGEAGHLTSFELSKTIEAGICKYLLDLNKRTDHEAQKTTGISSLAIGCAFGGLTVETSVRAVITGILNANNKIRNLRGSSISTIEHIEFIEQYEDKALACLYTLSKIENEKDRSLNIITDTTKIRSLLGWKKRMPVDYAEDWWNRINIQSIDNTEPGSLRFTIATGAAREEQRILYSNKAIIDSLLNEISSDNHWSEQTAKTIFELLIPNDFKEQVKKQSNITWIVDKETASYPWELLQDSINNAKPLCINAGMIRQLSTKNYRTRINMITNTGALVIADPQLSGYAPQLPGALREGVLVNDIFKNNGLQVNSSLQGSSSEIIKQIFSNDYKIIHLAGHGFFSNDHLQPSGMLIGNNVFLTTREISQMSAVPELVFVNCCYLGKTDAVEEQYYQDRYKLAANIGTQLIENGVKAVVVAGWAVDDMAAFDFTRLFYEHLFAGYAFGESILAARKFIFDKYGNENNTWGAYQCYGDPFYKLSTGNKLNRKKEYHFLIPEEAEIELGNLQNEMDTNRYSEKDYLENLQVISKTVDDNNLRTPKITEKEAFIYADLCEYELAIEKFETLFTNEQAVFMVTALEKYCNVRAKKYAADFKQKKQKATTLLTSVNKVIRDLENLLLLGETAERFILLGSAWKRKAYINGTLALKTKALETAAEYYLKAYMHPNNLYTIYCLTNWYSIQCIFSIQKKSYKWNQQIGSGNNAYNLTSYNDAEKQLQKLRKELGHESNMDFWDLSAVASIELCLYILGFNKTKKQTKDWKDIHATYKRIWQHSGPRGKKIAEIEHLEIITDTLNNIHNPDAKQLKGNLLLLSQELSKMA